MEFTAGMRVIVRNEEWIIRKVETNDLSQKVIYCDGISPVVKDKKGNFLTDLESISPVDPADVTFVIDKSTRFVSSRLFVESQWRTQVFTDAALHVGSQAAMDALSFQLVPAQIALRELRQRILIADTVGLGKTLEAGILISELIARGKGKRILVVTSKSMMLQFQKELWNRFTIPLIRMDSKKIQKIKTEIPANYNPFFYYDKAIISIDTLKQDSSAKSRPSALNVPNYRVHLENANWDIIVIDEAHNVAERNKEAAQRSKLAKLLATRSDNLIMLSATPHDGRPKSFASLIRMLDPTSIPDVNDYTKEDVGALCVRRHKKDVIDEVKSAFKKRAVTKIYCDASPAEEEAFDFFAGMSLKTDLKREKKRDSNILFKTGLEKALFSSPAACAKSIDERIKKLEKSASTDAASDISQLKTLKGYVENIGHKSFSRYNALARLLNSQNYEWSRDSDDRIVIFTERIETMKFIENHLPKDLKMDKSAVASMHGSMSDVDQQKLVEEFGQSQSAIRVLVATDVASEGINLHYLCHRVIHFDLPWSIMVFLQRNGRIDRYGQEKRPNIFYMVNRSKNEKIKGDMRIIEVLMDKEEKAQKNLGDPTLIMGKYDKTWEEKETADAIEAKMTFETFSDNLKKSEEKNSLLEIIMSGGSGQNIVADIREDKTLFSDIDYLETAIRHFGRNTPNAVTRLENVAGLEVKLSDQSRELSDLKARLKAVLPEEIMADRDYMQMSPDKNFCLQQMRESFQNSLSESAWPSTQYLWRLHPIFEWINDKAGLIYKRGEAPLIGLSDGVGPGDIIFVVAGVIPNRKSIPVVSGWFGLHYANGEFKQKITMNQIIERTGFGVRELPNNNLVNDTHAQNAQKLVKDAIERARGIFSQLEAEYSGKTNPLIDEELPKLEELRRRRIKAVKEQHQNGKQQPEGDGDLGSGQYDRNKDGKGLSKKAEERKNKEEEELRSVEKEFNDFIEFVKNSLETEKNPYLRIVAAIAGI
jgi:superfamily II DNA or RNA helicase